MAKINTMLDNTVELFVGDAILIHGQQDKKENCVNTKVFLGQVMRTSLTPVILVATSAANCGIELGHAAHYKGMMSDGNA
eukprot:scaffold27683_cov59-Attheya_sp.AAC.2